MKFRLTALLAPAFGLALAAALLWPLPAREALEAQGMSRLLAPSDSGPSLLVALLADDAPAAVHWSLRREGEPVLLDRAPGHRRAFVSAFAALNEERSARALAPIDLRPEPGAGLTLTLRTQGDRLFLTGATSSGRSVERGPWHVPGRGALLPPLVAIFIALITRRAIPALACGIWLGAGLQRVWAGEGLALAAAGGALDVFTRYFWRELTDGFRLEIIGFVAALLAMVGVMSRGGGVQGLVDAMLRFAHSVRSTLLVSFGMGCLIFFDDYSNCLIVGNTMRPLTDRLRISREKLAYIVDSTAAPIAGLSLFSTWIAFEVSTFAPQLPPAGIQDNPYVVFLQTLPFRFYSLFALGLVLLNVLLRRDFGPMLQAEVRARETGELVRAGGAPMVSEALTRMTASEAMRPRARNAAVPLITVVLVTLHEIFRRGGGYALGLDELSSFEGLSGILAEGGGAGALFVSASIGLGVAAVLVGTRAVRAALALGSLAGLAAWAAALAFPLPFLAAAGGAGLGALAVRELAPPSGAAAEQLPLAELARAATGSIRALGFAVVILFEAWMIGQVCEDVHTSDYLIALSAGVLDALWLPVLLFALACVVSFATGTSWGTMSILLPSVVGLAAAVGADHTIGSFGLVLVCIGAVLEGSIFGDHCSPISDTTVLSSVACASDHIDHVRTQAPYALLAAAVAVLAGYLPTLLWSAWSPPAALAAGFTALAATLLLVGRRADG